MPIDRYRHLFRRAPRLLPATRWRRVHSDDPTNDLVAGVEPLVAAVSARAPSRAKRMGPWICTRRGDCNVSVVFDLDRGDPQHQPTTTDALQRVMQLRAAQAYLRDRHDGDNNSTAPQDFWYRAAPISSSNRDNSSHRP